MSTSTEVTELVTIAGIEVPPEVAEFLPDNLPSLVDDLEAEVARAKENAESVEIVDDESAAAAENLLTEVVRQRKAIETERKSLTKPRKDAAEAIKKRLDEVAAPFAKAEESLRATVGNWHAEQEFRRSEAEAWLENEQRDRERIVREAREREEAAARERAEKAARDAREASEIAAEDGDEEMEAFAEEAAIEAQEAATSADAIAALPDVSLPVPVVPAAPRTGGVVATKRWVAEVTDITKLPDFLPDGTPLKAVIASALNGHMHATLKATGQPPVMAGAKFEQKTGQSVRS